MLKPSPRDHIVLDAGTGEELAGSPAPELVELAVKTGHRALSWAFLGPGTGEWFLLESSTHGERKAISDRGVDVRVVRVAPRVKAKTVGRPVTIQGPRKISVTLDGVAYAVVEDFAARERIPWAEALRRIVRAAGELRAQG